MKYFGSRRFKRVGRCATNHILFQTLLNIQCILRMCFLTPVYFELNDIYVEKQ